MHQENKQVPEVSNTREHLGHSAPTNVFTTNGGFREYKYMESDCQSYVGGNSGKLYMLLSPAGATAPSALPDC